MSPIAKLVVTAVVAFALGFLAHLALAPESESSPSRAVAEIPASNPGLEIEGRGDGVHLRPAATDRVLVAFGGRLATDAEGRPSGATVAAGGLVAEGRLQRVRGGALAPCHPDDGACTPVEPDDDGIVCFLGVGGIQCVALEPITSTGPAPIDPPQP